MGWGYTPGYPGVQSRAPVSPMAQPPSGSTRPWTRSHDDARFDVAIVGAVLLSVLSLLGHAVPVYRWGAGSPSVTAAPSVPGPGPTAPTPGGPSPSPSAPTPTPTSPRPSGAPAAARAVPPTPVVDAVCLRADNPRTGAKLPPGDPFGDDPRRLGSGSELQRLFAVKDGALAPLDGLGAPRTCDQQLWALVTTLAPTQVRFLDEFLVFDSGTGSGGVKVGESAPKRVSARAYDESHWRLSLAPNRMDRSDLAWLVAHELAHIASLNSGQLSPTTPRCPDELTFTDCLSDSSYLKRYIATGWPADLVRDWDRVDPASGSDPQSAFRKFFQAHRSSFITAYAATHPHEDFAESFAMWCTYDPGEPTRAQLPKRAPSDSGSKVEWFSTLTVDLVPEFDPGCQALRKFAAS